MGWLDTERVVTYPEIAKDFPKDSDEWNCRQWEVYFDRVKKKKGVVKAMKVVKLDMAETGFFSNLRMVCTNDCDFLAFTKMNGLGSWGNPFSYVGCGISDVSEIPGNVAEAGLNISEGIRKYSGFILLGGLAAGAAYLYFNYKKLI